MSFYFALDSDVLLYFRLLKIVVWVHITNQYAEFEGYRWEAILYIYNHTSYILLISLLLYMVGSGVLQSVF